MHTLSNGSILIIFFLKIAITYFSIREDSRIIVASEFIVEPFSPIFVNDWPISVPTLKEAAARMLAVTVVKD